MTATCHLPKGLIGGSADECLPHLTFCTPTATISALSSTSPPHGLCPPWQLERRFPPPDPLLSLRVCLHCRCHHKREQHTNRPPAEPVAERTSARWKGTESNGVRFFTWRMHFCLKRSDVITDRVSSARPTRVLTNKCHTDKMSTIQQQKEVEQEWARLLHITRVWRLYLG